MALGKRDLRATYDGRRPDKRMTPKEGGGTAVGVLAPQTGAPLLPEGTPLAWDTSASKWTVFTQGGSNGTNLIKAFVGDSGGVQSHATDDVQVLLFKAGTVHRDDVNTAAILAVLGGSASEANVDTALQAHSVRQVGIDVQGLAGIN